MNLQKAEGRDKEIRRRKNGMRVTGKGVFLIQEIWVKRAKKNKKEGKDE